MRFATAAILLSSVTLLVGCGAGADDGDPTSPTSGTLSPVLAADIMRGLVSEFEITEAIASVATLPPGIGTIAARQQAAGTALPDITIDTTRKECPGGGTRKFNQRSITNRPGGGTAVADMLMSACMVRGDFDVWTLDSDPSLRNTIAVSTRSIPEGGLILDATIDLVGNLRYRGVLASGRCASNMRWVVRYTVTSAGVSSSVRLQGDMCGTAVDEEM